MEKHLKDKAVALITSGLNLEEKSREEPGSSEVCLLEAQFINTKIQNNLQVSTKIMMVQGEKLLKQI